MSYEDLRGILNGLFNTSDGQDRTVSFLGTARYSYKDRYVLNFNYRADGADVIGEDNRFTPLWSSEDVITCIKRSFLKIIF